MPEKPVGKVEHYYPKVQAAAVRLSKKVKVGDEVHIVGHGDDFKETVTSMQLDHQPIQEGQPGQSVGLWVKERVHEGDDVLLVEPDEQRLVRSARRGAKQAARGKRASPRKASAKRKPARKAKAARRAKPARRVKATRRAPSRKPASRKAPSRKAASRARPKPTKAKRSKASRKRR